MPRRELVDELAQAILDGSSVNWAAACASAGDGHRPLVEQLRVLAAVADLHRRTPPPDVWGHLRVLEPIGRGAFGEVYRAWDTRLDREVALKLLRGAGSPRASSSIIREGQLLARVRHPNVVTIYGAEERLGEVGLWMEFIRGRTLEQVVAQETRLGPDDVVAIGRELCRATAAVHTAGLLHRDIKANNVMRGDDGRIVLMDLGAGRELDAGVASDLAGTPLYLAPEVLAGQPATVRSDIYSLGVLLYHLLTGLYPIRARTLDELRRAHAHGERIPVLGARSDVPLELARVVQRAIDPDPERRHATVDALGAALADVTRRSTLAHRLDRVGMAAAVALLVGASWAGPPADRTSLAPGAMPRESAGATDAAAVSRAAPPVIAVLPLENLSAEADSEYFVDGLTDEIIRNLAGIDGLAVRSRTSSFSFKDRPRNVREAGRRLGADFVVEGSVLRSGTKLRVNAQLVHVADDATVWADRYDRELKDVFAIQDEISRSIVNALRLTLGRGQRRYHTNLAAYELYLKARGLIDRRDLPNAQMAADLFAQVIAIDDAFAPAHAGLANAYAFLSTPWRGISLASAYPIMRPAAVRALQLDPLLADAHMARGWVYAYDRDWANAERAFEKAIELNPSLTQIYTSYSISTLQALGAHDKALRLLEAARGNDPFSLDVQREIGEVQLAAGRYQDAIATLERVYAVDPEFPFVTYYLARALLLTGRTAEASAIDLVGPIVPALVLAQRGRRAEATRLVEQEGNPFVEAVVAGALDDRPRAFAAIDRVAAGAPHRLGRLLQTPELRPLRDHHRVVALRRQFGLP